MQPTGLESAGGSCSPEQSGVRADPLGKGPGRTAIGSSPVEPGVWAGCLKESVLPGKCGEHAGAGAGRAWGPELGAGLCRCEGHTGRSQR